MKRTIADYFLTISNFSHAQLRIERERFGSPSLHYPFFFLPIKETKSSFPCALVIRTHWKSMRDGETLTIPSSPPLILGDYSPHSHYSRTHHNKDSLLRGRVRTISRLFNILYLSRVRVSMKKRREPVFTCEWRPTSMTLLIFQYLENCE